MSKELTKKENTEIAQNIKDVFAEDYQGVTGLENLIADDFAHAVSDVVEQELIEGIKPGDFYYGDEGIRFGKSLKAIVLTTYTIWLETSGPKKIKNVYSIEDFDKKIDTLKEHPENPFNYIDPETGNTFSKIKNALCVLPDYLDYGIMVVSFSSGNVKNFNKWMTKIGKFNYEGRSAAYNAVWELVNTKKVTGENQTWRTTQQNFIEWTAENASLRKVVSEAMPLVQEYIKKIDFTPADSQNTPEESEF